MARPGAALINLLLLLDLPPGPEVGHAGLEHSPLLRALAHHAGRMVELIGRDPGTAALDLGVLHGEARPSLSGTIRPGGWIVQFGNGNPASLTELGLGEESIAETRRWLIGPSLSFPLSIVPDTRVARRAHEMVNRESSWKRSLRLAAIDRGWRPKELGGVAVAARIR